MGRWFGSAPQVSPPTPQPEVLAPEALISGLVLRIDAAGLVQSLAGELRGELALREAGRPLADYLMTHARGLSPDCRDWQAELVDLDFRTPAGEPLYTRGWLQPDGQGWRLQLLAVGDLLKPLREQERRRHCLSLAGRLAEHIRGSSEERLQAAAEQVLAELCETFAAGAAAWAWRGDGGHWQVYARSGGQPSWPSGRPLNEALATAAVTTPLQLPGASRLGPAPVFLLPYQDREGQVAWLMLDDFVAAQRAPGLHDSDWLQLAAQLASALLARLARQQESRERARLATLQELLGAGWWEYHLDTQQIELAPLLAHELGLQGPELALEAWLQQLHAADREEFRVRLTNLAAGGDAFSQSLRLGAEGEPVWYQMQARQLGQGRRRRVCGFLLDISDIKTQQAHAAAAHARLSNLLASAPAVIYVQRCEDGALQFEYCSESLQPLLGWSLAELKGGMLAELVHADDLQAYFTRGRTLLAQGAVSCRYRVRDRAGSYHWLLDEAKLLRDELGQPREVAGVWLDVTEATLAAERIRESEERYRILVEDSPAMICRYSADLTLNFANRPLADYLELTPAQLVGSNLCEWLSEEQRQAFADRLAGLSPQQPLSTAEICMMLPGREHAWWVWSDRGHFDASGRLIEIQAVARDNTEVRRAQQQLLQSAKMATLGEMATGMAHEMNQPLNVMRMAVANVLRRTGQGEVPVDYLRDKLNRIEAQVERAARIVDHMRVFGRRSEVEQRPFDPFEAVAGALSLLEENLRGKGVAVAYSPWDGESPLVSGFSDQLEQVLINLMVNARDAMLSRQAREASFTPQLSVHGERHGARLQLIVADNGGGIEPRLLERIFEPFFTTKPVGKGTGLGLSVSYSIVQQMGGELSVSNSEIGARFCIDLPLMQQAGPGLVS